MKLAAKASLSLSSSTGQLGQRLPNQRLGQTIFVSPAGLSLSLSSPSSALESLLAIGDVQHHQQESERAVQPPPISGKTARSSEFGGANYALTPIGQFAPQPLQAPQVVGRHLQTISI